MNTLLTVVLRPSFALKCSNICSRGLALSTAVNTNESMILTDRCVEQLSKIADNDEYLRVTVDSGGCSGFEYKFKLDRQVNDDDHRIVVNGAKVIVDTLSLEYVRGATLDFQQELIRSSFRILKNPLAEKGCSCGSSFAMKMD